MSDELDSLLANFQRAATGASLDAIRIVEQRLTTVFPPDYVAFMQESDGGEGDVGTKGYIQLWPIGTLVEQNDGYETKSYFRGFVFLGSNGGGEAIALRSGANGPELFLTPFIGAASDALFGGRSFAEFLSAYGSGRIWKREERDP
jgi:hypothetical protein